MNKDNAKDYLPLVQALSEGKVIQHRIGTEEWYDREQFDFADKPEQYRIKPEPREIWVNEYPNEINSAYRSYDLAASHCLDYGKTVRYREVIE